MNLLSSRTFPLVPIKAAFRLVSQTNPRAQREILKAVLANNPSFALLNAWSELEYQVSKKVRMDRQNSPNQQIIKEVSKTLRLPKKSATRLRTISQKRNGVAHAIQGRDAPTWGDVIFVMRTAKKYRRMKT